MSRPFNRVLSILFRFEKFRRKKISREMIKIVKIVRKGIMIVGRKSNLLSFNRKRRKLISSTLMHSKIIKIINLSLNPKPHWAPNLTSSRAKGKEINFSYPIETVIM